MKYFEHPKSHIRDYVIEVHIADIHFGSIDPMTQYTILHEQFINKIAIIDFDILSIDGDIFDKKFMANSDTVFYAMKFVQECVELCVQRQATIIIISGTESHDSGQLKLFYGYLDMDNVDMRIVEHINIEYVQGLSILCIPEEYGKGEDYYNNFLDKEYNTAFIHGTVVGSVYGATKENLNSAKYPIFSIDSFSGCRGPIICGHVHKAMCLNGYIYYCSNPIRYKFGEEEEKGFNIVLHNKFTNNHSINFIPIQSFRYDTISIKDLELKDPDLIISHLDSLLINGIDHIRIVFDESIDSHSQKIIEKYYLNNPNVAIKRNNEQNTPTVNTTDEIEQKYSKLDFLLDPSLDGYTKFVNFINYNMGKEFITVDMLKKVLSEK